MEDRYGGDMEVVLISQIWVQYPLYGYLWIHLDKCSPDPATSRLWQTSGQSWSTGKTPPSRAPTFDIGVTPISNVKCQNELNMSLWGIN